MREGSSSSEFRVNLPEDLSKRLKIYCILNNINYKVILEQAVADFLNEKDSANNPAKGRNPVR